jgi:HEAT repeat protein
MNQRKVRDMGGLKGRDLKQRVRMLLESTDDPAALRELGRFPARKIVNPLFSFLYHTDEALRWRAVAFLGFIVSELADRDRESARVVIRRLMWNLNDESGGIGWGSAEALGEIMARHKGLATEYANILISYIREDGNFQEHELMQRGVLWGIARLAEKHPELLSGAVPPVRRFLDSDDPLKRGLSARILGLLHAKDAEAELVRLSNDESGFLVYLDGALQRSSVSRMAKWALEKLQEPG